MIRLEIAGIHTQLCSTLCAQCPQGATGCCKSPPEHDWSDIGRVVALGGRDWLLDQLAQGNLLPSARGLSIRRARGRASPASPRQSKCVYHGPRGCTLTTARRPATCNYFLCEDAYVDGGERRGADGALAARRAHAALMEQYERWDRELFALIAASFPEGVRWDAAFLDWLGGEVVRLPRGPRSAILSG
jgi:hypothetical protein